MSAPKSTDGNLLKSIAANAKGVTEKATTGIASAATAVASVIPNAKTIKQGVGRALVFGGRTLIDPKATVGELAVDLGQRLSGPDEVGDWLALVATDTGFLALARGDEAAARVAMEAARAEGNPVILCKVLAAHTGKAR